MRLWHVYLACSVACAAWSPTRLLGEDTDRPRIGDEIAALRFKDIRFLPRSLDDFGEQRAYVVVFTSTTCPLVRRYWPKLKRLDEQFRGRGVQFVGVNAGPGDTIPDVAQQAIDFGVEFPVVKDADGSCVRAVGVERTPEVVILDGEHRLRYRGRIDDQYRLGGARPEVAHDDLQHALEDLLEDRPVGVQETTVDGCRITLPSAPRVDGPVTFYEQVQPLLQRHCQECHRGGQTAPFSLITLDEVAGHAEAIAEVVAEGRMPPWYANRQQPFANERGLSSAERNQIVAWTRKGRPLGDAEKAPPPLTFRDSAWDIGEPDLVTTALETHSLPPDGFVDYKYSLMPHVFLDETWISAAEIRPSNPGVVHHCNLGYVALGQQFTEGNFITGRVPGGTPMILDDGLALRIPKNSVLALQIHYTTTGKPETNRMSVGLRFPRGTVRQELHHVQATTSRFEIPPGAAAHPVTAVRTVPFDASGLGMFAHMHLRGKDMTFRAIYPSGESETLLSIPNYHYDWQQNYRWTPGTKKFPRGTRIEVTAHFDNSRFNPFNPDPTATVRHGPQTVQEMTFGFFFYTADGEDLQLKVDPKTGRRQKGPIPPPR
jgi:hypothetical protein